MGARPGPAAVDRPVELGGEVLVLVQVVDQGIGLVGFCQETASPMRPVFGPSGRPPFRRVQVAPPSALL